MRRAINSGFAAFAASACLIVSGCGGGESDKSGSEPAPSAAIAADHANEAAAPAVVQIAPERYFGRFGDSANPGEMRGQYFVTAAHPPPMADNFPEIPLGYIMISAAWADVSPYYLKPLSATRFEQQFLSSFDPVALIVEFELDGEGNAVAFRFENLPNDTFGRRTRLGDVPDEYR